MEHDETRVYTAKDEDKLVKKLDFAEWIAKRNGQTTTRKTPGSMSVYLITDIEENDKVYEKISVRSWSEKWHKHPKEYLFGEIANEYRRD